MKPVTRLPWALALAAGLIVTTGAHGATITFSAADFTNVNQLSTTGTLVEAINFGNANAPDIELNDVIFEGAGASSDHLSVESGNAFHNPGVYNPGLPNQNTTGLSDTDGNKLLDSSVFGLGTGSNLVTLTNLTEDQPYEFQVLLVDDRGGNEEHTMTFSQAGGSDPSVGPLDFTSNIVQIITGSFTADGTTQQFDIARDDGNNANNAFINVSFRQA